MKTDIIVPKPISRAAKQLARQLGISLNEFYASAITAFVVAHRREMVTDALNRVYDTEPSELDPVISKMQAGSLQSESW